MTSFQEDAIAQIQTLIIEAESGTIIPEDVNNKIRQAIDHGDCLTSGIKDHRISQELPIIIDSMRKTVDNIAYGINDLITFCKLVIGMWKLDQQSDTVKNLIDHAQLNLQQIRLSLNSVDFDFDKAKANIIESLIIIERILAQVQSHK
jgi:hypothetical protein